MSSDMYWTGRFSDNVINLYLKVPYSKLGRVTTYSDWGYLWFSSITPKEFWDNNLQQVTNVSFKILEISSFMIMLPPHSALKLRC
jgi:hypothetical protein